MEPNQSMASYRSCWGSQLRFGVSVAKVRSRYQKVMKLHAKRFLREAAKNAKTNSSNTSQNSNKFWMQHANLAPILDYLAKQ